MKKDYRKSSIVSVSIDEYVMAVRYLPEDEKYDEYDVYLKGEMLLEGLANFEAHSISRVLTESHRDDYK